MSTRYWASALVYEDFFNVLYLWLKGPAEMSGVSVLRKLRQTDKMYRILKHHSHKSTAIAEF